MEYIKEIESVHILGIRSKTLVTEKVFTKADKLIAIGKRLPHGNAKQVRDLGELLKKSNITTLYVPANPTTHKMINRETLSYL